MHPLTPYKIGSEAGVFYSSLYRASAYCGAFWFRFARRARRVGLLPSLLAKTLLTSMTSPTTFRATLIAACRDIQLPQASRMRCPVGPGLIRLPMRRSGVRPDAGVRTRRKPQEQLFAAAEVKYSLLRCCSRPSLPAHRSSPTSSAHANPPPVRSARRSRSAWPLPPGR